MTKKHLQIYKATIECYPTTFKFDSIMIDFDMKNFHNKTVKII